MIKFVAKSWSVIKGRVEIRVDGNLTPLNPTQRVFVPSQTVEKSKTPPVYEGQQ